MGNMRGEVPQLEVVDREPFLIKQYSAAPLHLEAVRVMVELWLDRRKRRARGQDGQGASLS